VLRSAWILGVGSLITLWYACKVLLLSFSRKPEELCRSCHSVGRRWSQAILKLAGVSVNVEGAENLAFDGAFLIISNHESWFDAWALAGCLPIDAHFTAKKELERIPVFGRAWRACGHISIDRADRASAIESMTRAGLQIKEQGLNMVFFAEGTRCSDGTLNAFKKGPFVIAIEGGVPIVPLGLVGSRGIMPKGSFRIRRGTIVLHVGEPVSVAGMEHADRDHLRDTVRDAVARLRGGEGRTFRLPGEPPLDDVPGPSRSNANP